MREAFDIHSKTIYLNSANLSLCPRSVIESMHRYHLEFEKNPTQGLAGAWPMLWDRQCRLGRFLKARPHELFLRSNVTSTLNTFLLGMPLPKDSEILVGELEYGAIVNICRMRAERDGLDWRILKMPASAAAIKQLSPERLVENIVSQFSSKTRLVLLSHVIAGTGLVLPIEQIAAQTRARGIYLAIDGAYAPGALSVDFTTLDDVDFYGCSLYKWLMGPKGTAFGWCPERHHDRIEPINAGWTTYDTRGPIINYGDGGRFQSSMLMAGCHDFAPFSAINETLDFWESHAPERIRERLAELGNHLDKAVQSSLGWLPLHADAPQLQGPMWVYRFPSRLQSRGEQLAKFILDELGIQINCVCLRGEWYASFSPHVYNTDEEIQETVSRLSSRL
jgi:isopenicillin-N epimerase